LKKRICFGLVLCLLLITANAFAADGLLKYGMRGDDVQLIQTKLADAGYYTGEVDGVFGSMMVQAVQAFQRSNGLSPDGVVGEQTRAYLERTGAEPSRYSRALTMNASAYTAHDDGNSNTTYRGNPVHKGLVAVDPSVIPLGTRLYIPGYGYAVADDIGGAIRGNRIDMAFDNRSEALQFGRQQVTVYILD
jgi:3D (Asp-Asp-Asp) domain-containing protein